MKVNFLIDEDYLIADTLSSMGPHGFSSRKNKKEIVAFQNLAWSRSKKCYNFIVGRASPEDFISDQNLESLAKELPRFLSSLKESDEYSQILEQTKEYLDSCKRQFKDNHEKSASAIREITGLEIDGTFDVYITHPSLMNGCNLGNNRITWGHAEEWPNYTTVYLWHEILHSYFKRTDVDHALIQLIAENELRVRLNRGSYPPFEGHKDLFPLMKRLLPHWKRYLKSEDKNIMRFREKMESLMKE